MDFIEAIIETRFGEVKAVFHGDSIVCSFGNHRSGIDDCLVINKIHYYGRFQLDKVNGMFIPQRLSSNPSQMDYHWLSMTRHDPTGNRYYLGDNISESARRKVLDHVYPAVAQYAVEHPELSKYGATLTMNRHVELLSAEAARKLYDYEEAKKKLNEAINEYERLTNAIGK